MPVGFDTTTSPSYPPYLAIPSGRSKTFPPTPLPRILNVSAMALSCQAGSYAENQGEALSPRFRAVNEWFADWDRDGDGMISRKELERGLRKLGIFMSEVKTKGLFFCLVCIRGLKFCGGGGALGNRWVGNREEPRTNISCHQTPT